MPEFEDMLAQWNANEVALSQLLAESGRRVRFDVRNPRDVQRLLRANEFVSEVVEGRRTAVQFREAMSTSDFAELFGVVLDRRLYGGYAEAAYTWNQVARRATVPDFRTVERYVVDGAEGVLDDVAELAPYPERQLSDNKYTYKVTKRGARLALSWEAMINDDLGAFLDLPSRFGRAARRTEDKSTTQMYVDASGPHASFYTSGNKNIINATNAGGGFTANNPALSIAGVQQGMVVLANQIDADGEPIAIDAITLVVPPGLEITALNIANALQLEITGDVGGGTSNQKIITANWMRNRLRLAVNPYIPRVATTANGNTSWFLFADPNSGRPALEKGFLRGHEAPEIFEKLPNAQRVGGGMDMADFDTDSREWKVRHVFGDVRVDPKMSVASNGSGS